MQSNLFKKLVSLTLAVCLFLGSCPVSTLADALNTKVSASPMADDVEKQNPQTPVDSYVASAPRMNAVSISDDISNGTVTASPKSAAEGKVVTLTVTPDQYYELDTLTVKVRKTGAEVATTQAEDGTYTFKMPDGDVKVAATFSEKTYNTEIDDIDMAHGWVSANPDTAKANDTVTLTITPDDGYAVDTLTVTDTNGNTVTTTKVEKNKYTFAMPAGGATVSATFAKPTFTVKMYTSTQQQTVDAGTTFSAWVWDNPDYNTASYWSVTRADGTSQRANVDSLGEIENGDVYELIAAMNLGSTVVLEVYGPCDVDELTFAEWCSGFEFFSGSLTVHHTVDGEEKDFVLTNNKYRLADFANGAKWSVDGEAANMNYSVPLTKTAFTTQPGTITLPIDLVGGKVEADKSTAKQGEDVTLTITADEHYALTTLTLNGGENVAANVTEGEYTFTMPANDVTIAATFQLEDGYHTITMNADPAGSAYVVGGKAVEKEGETVYIAAAEGYRLPDAITVRDGNRQNVPVGWDNGQCYFTMPDSNVTITLKPDRIYSVTVDTPVGGTVEPIKNTYKEGDTVKVVVEANNGYQVLSVTATAEDGTTITASQSPTSEISYIFTMPASNVTIKAEFGQRHAVNIPGFDNGRVYISTPDYYKGETVTLNVRAKTGYKLTALTVTDADGNDVPLTTVTDNITYTFAMPDSEATVSATFEAITYTITLNANPEGSAYVKDGKTAATINDTIVIVAAKGYELKTVTTGGLANTVWGTTDTGANDYTWAYFTMPGDDVVVTVNARRVYTVTVAPTTNGTMTVDKPTVREDENRKVYVQGTPDEGYRLNSITVTDENGNTVPHSYVSTNKYAFDMPDSDVSITGEFVRVYNVTVGKTANGTIMREPKTAAEGELVNVAVRANMGYELEKLTVDGEDVTADVAMGSYEFSMPTHDVNITVTFKLSDGYHHISVAPVTGGTLTVIDGDGVPVDVAKSGTQLYVAVSSDEAYLLDGDVTCTANGTTTDLEANLSGTYMFTMPDADVTIGAKFTKGYKVALNPTSGAFDNIALENTQVDSHGNIVAKAGDPMKLTLACNDSYRIKSVTAAQADGTSVTLTLSDGSYTFVMPEADITITITAERLYTVDIEEAPQQWFAMQGAATRFAAGETVTLTADCSKVYRYVSLTKDNGGEVGFTADQTAGTLTFTMPEDNVTLEAGIFDDYYFVTIVTVGGDSICTVDVGHSEEQDALTGRPGVRAATMVKANVTCPETYAYEWEVTLANGDRHGYGNGTAVDFNMPSSNVTLTVTFTSVYKVSIPEALSAYVSIPDGKPTKYAAGETVQLQVTEVAGKVITALGVDVLAPEMDPVTCEPNSGLLTFTMPNANVEVYGNVVDAYHITLVEDGIPEGCTVSLSANKDWLGRYYAAAKEGVYVLGTAEGYQVTWEAKDEGGTGAGGPLGVGFAMRSSDMTVTFKFIRVYNVTISEAEHGKVTMNRDSTSCPAKREITFTITPDDGYRLKKLTVDGADCTQDVNSYNDYVYTMPDHDVTVTAEFVRVYKVTINESSMPYAALPAGADTQYEAGETVTLDITEVSGKVLAYMNARYQEGGFLKTAAYTYDAENSTVSFTMPSADVEILIGTLIGYYITLETVGGDENCEVELNYDISLINGKYYKMSGFHVEATKLVAPGYGWEWTATAAGGTTVASGEGDIAFNMPQADVIVTVAFHKLYDITVGESTNGTVAADKTQSIAGKQVSLTVTPDYGYELDTLFVNSENVAANVAEGAYTFTMPESNVTISATFKLKEGYHTITLNVTPEGTAFVSDGKHVAKKGDAVSIGATANYRLVSKTVTDQNGDSVNYGGSVYWLNFNMPDSDVTVTLTTERVYNVSVADVTGGTVNLMLDKVAEGKTAYVTVKPDENYRLAQVTATDADGNELPVQETRFPIGVAYCVTMPASDVTFTVVFKREYQVNIAAELAHYVTLKSEENSFIEGETVTLQVGEWQNELFSELSVDVEDAVFEPLTSTITFTMPDRDVTVQGKVVIGYFIGINKVGGDISCQVDTSLIPTEVLHQRKYALAGDEVKADITCPGYVCEWKAVLTGGTMYASGTGAISFTMPESNVTITVTFTKMYNVTVSETANGTVAVDQPLVKADETVTITVTPDEDCVVQSVTVTGEHGPVTVDSGENNTYQFTMPAENVTVEVVIQRRYTVSIAGNGAAYCSTLDGQTQYAEGATVQVNIDLPAGKVLYSLLVIDSTNQALVPATLEDDALTFTMPAGNVGISVEVKDGYYVTINMEGAGENEGCSYMENENVFNLWYGQQYGAAAGSEVTLVAFPGAGYGYTVNVTRADGGEVAHLPLNGGVDVRFTMPESDVTITITFFPVYKVTIADDIADYFTIKDDEDEFAEDETVTISLHIPEGKVLQTLNIVKDETLEELPFTKNGSKLTFTMPAADVSLYARVADGYYINVVTENAPDDDDWLLTPNPNVQQEQGTMNYFAAAAEEVAFAAVCPYGYGCTVSVTSEDDDDITYLSVDDEWDVRFIMPESDVTITITFMQGYKVYLTDSDKAYFTILGEKTRFPEGETVQIKMDIPAGKVLEYLTIDTDDGVESISFTDENGLLTFTMPGQDVIVSTQLLDGYYIFGVLEGTYDEGCNYQTNTQGSAYYSCDIAEPGEQVEMTISCTYGYDYTVSVTRADGGEVEYLPLPDGSDLCFTMPECNVTVTIKYELTPPSYIISIPASVSMNDDEPLRIIAYSVEHLRGQTITVNATSANGNKLVSGDYSIDYTLDTTTLTFAEDDAQEIGLILGDKTNKPAGTYTDTLNFTVSLTTPPESDDQEE